MEYFRFFQVGFNTPPPGLLAFLDRIIAPDVTDGPICGADTLVKNWAMLSLSFEDITVQLERLDRAGDDLLVATTTTSITIRSETLRRVFPHLLGHDDISLATKLQDQRIVMRSSVRFDWDSSTRRIVRMLSQADMLTPILHLLGNVQDVSRVFDEALHRVGSGPGGINIVKKDLATQRQEDDGIGVPILALSIRRQRFTLLQQLIQVLSNYTDECEDVWYRPIAALLRRRCGSSSRRWTGDFLLQNPPEPPG
ncbi:hypothetical protein P3T76_000713 [Phytophthora citrophthora]|uniref:Uncharacterized protein n=1 Tax=Phytophthora citrophthora TaxID=4793 RepID=A0AAD9H146_9STRA|nr:hypothetical protein P3T76_000713 [Phytophthora citrophthora]